MIYFKRVFIKILNTCFKKVVDGPFSTDSANSHHGNFSLVQKTNGIAVKQIYFYLKNRK